MSATALLCFFANPACSNWHWLDTVDCLCALLRSSRNPFTALPNQSSVSGHLQLRLPVAAMSLRPSERVSYAMLFVVGIGTFCAVLATSQLKKIGAMPSSQSLEGASFDRRFDIFNKKE